MNLTWPMTQPKVKLNQESRATGFRSKQRLWSREPLFSWTVVLFELTNLYPSIPLGWRFFCDRITYPFGMKLKNSIRFFFQIFLLKNYRFVSAKNIVAKKPVGCLAQHCYINLFQKTNDGQLSTINNQTFWFKLENILSSQNIVTFVSHKHQTKPSYTN